MAGASVVATASATGLRAWIGARRPGWLTPKLMKVTTACLLTLGVLAAGLQP
ncbi:MAG TPA: hypothetical protein VMF31_14535 [Solirubrobacterales bacterium]|nr:hypothetical protein [Solirubrobacterales bacterium]